MCVPKLAALLDDAENDVLAYMGFPAQHRAKLHSTNPPRSAAPTPQNGPRSESKTKPRRNPKSQQTLVCPLAQNRSTS